MKRKLFIFTALLLLSFSAAAQYESASKPVEINYKKIEEQIGKQYWIKANTKAINRQIFKNELNSNTYQNNEFVVTSDLKFDVIGWANDEINFPHLKIRFEDGKIAFIEVAMWDFYKDVLPDVFNGSTYSDYTEYFFKGKPDQILASWKNNKVTQKAKADAEYKAKGGVKIGMTKEAVLKSNWGKPSSVNKSTNANGVSEQWVYGTRNYLYFNNGFLTSIQN